MEFHAELIPRPFVKKITHKHNLLLVGSCFTEQIGNKLLQHKFSVLDNPNGILFNPVSIARAVDSYISEKQYEASDLFYNSELWGSWDHHTRFSSTNIKTTLENINASQQRAATFIKKADWILLTLGSAFVYEHTTADNKGGYEQVVANCHKVPADKFNRRLLEINEIKTVLEKMIMRVKEVNPAVQFIFTISPVRHLREGFIENNRSKSALIQAVHSLVNNMDVFYFPAYELVIDDLRDYRFFAEDMVHPNYAATNYVWEKFKLACIDEQSQQLMKEIAVIMAARNHKPFNPLSVQHQKFLKANLEKIQEVRKYHPYLDFASEERYFTMGD